MKLLVVGAVIGFVARWLLDLFHWSRETAVQGASDPDLSVLDQNMRISRDENPFGDR